MTTDTKPTTPADREALIEQIARGIQMADGLQGIMDWEDVPEHQRSAYIHVARHGLERAEAAGVIPVRKEDAEKLYEIARRPDYADHYTVDDLNRDWSAMRTQAARLRSPYAKEG